MLSLLSAELGVHHLRTAHSRRDVALLLVSRFVRMASFGAFAPVLILFLRGLAIPEERIGFFLSATLAGDVLVSLAVTYTADKVGRRRMMALGSLLMCLSGLAFNFSSSFLVLVIAAVVGIISPSGNEVGPFSALEQAALSQLTEPEGRVYVLMWHQVLGFFGISAGNMLCGFLTSAAERAGKLQQDVYRPVFAACAVLGGVKVLLSFFMTRTVEVDHEPVNASPAAAASPTARPTDSERQPLLPPDNPLERTAPPPPPPALPMGRLVALCLIFGLDSFASSLAPLSFVSYYLRTDFFAPIPLITRVFSITALIGCASQLAAGPISKRLGIIMTMVATHMPAQLLTIALAFAPNLSSALTFFIARACINTMDASVRGAFLAAVIPKASRTRFLGVINICKTLAATPGPTLSLGLASLGGMRWAFVLTGSIKLIYDVCLFVGFQTAKLEH
ncbi:hypothetical protein JCM6882_003495 [Rhodosporidiobolus microsporus]